MHTNRLDDWSRKVRCPRECLSSLRELLKFLLVSFDDSGHHRCILVLHLSYRGDQRRLGPTSRPLPVSVPVPPAFLLYRVRFLSRESLLRLPILYNLTHLSRLSDLGRNSLASPSISFHHPRDIVLCLLPHSSPLGSCRRHLTLIFSLASSPSFLDTLSG